MAALLSRPAESHSMLGAGSEQQHVGLAGLEKPSSRGSHFQGRATAGQGWVWAGLLGFAGLVLAWFQIVEVSAVGEACSGHINLSE